MVRPVCGADQRRQVVGTLGGERAEGGHLFPGVPSRPMAIRVVQWATGGVGRAAIEGIVRHPDLELVGCWVHSAAKAGQDAGALAGVDPLGVEASSSEETV